MKNLNVRAAHPASSGDDKPHLRSREKLSSLEEKTTKQESAMEAVRSQDIHCSGTSTGAVSDCPQILAKVAELEEENRKMAAKVETLTNEAITRGRMSNPSFVLDMNNSCSMQSGRSN